MIKLFQIIRDWSEVWALLIPLVVIVVIRPKGPGLWWLKLYTVLGLCLNFISIFSVEYYDLMPSWLRSGNNLFYNLHSFLMVICFGLFLSGIISRRYANWLKILVAVYIVFVLVNFIFFQNPIKLSTIHFTIGSIVLLIHCLFYFLSSLFEETQVNWLRHPSFIICSGLCLYQAITFFIFLFIYPLFDRSLNQDISFAILMMRVYQLIFVIFCITLAIGLYQYRKGQKPNSNTAL